MLSSVLALWTLLIQDKNPSFPCNEIWSTTSSSSQNDAKNFFLKSKIKAVNVRVVRHSLLLITQDWIAVDSKL